MTAERFWDGNRACAEGALLAGLGFYGGYPITPSTEIAEFLSWRLPQEGGVFIQMEDEIASLAACLGASQGGCKAMTATSGPGFSLMQENIGFGCMAEIPVVIVNVQRLGPSTGQPTRPAQGDLMQSIWGTHGDHPIIVLSPCSAQEMLDMTVRAFNLAERFRSPVILLADEVVAHMREKISLPQSVERWERPAPAQPPSEYVPYAETADGVPPFASFGDGGYRYHVTGLFHDQDGFPVVDAPSVERWFERAFRKLDLKTICAWELDGAPRGTAAGSSTLLVSYGASARAAAAAVRMAAEQGRPLSHLRLQTVWPLDEEMLRPILRDAQRVLVVEMNRGQMLREMQRLGGDHVQGVLRWDGDMVSPRAILEAI